MERLDRWFYGPGGLILTIVLIALGGFFAITGGVSLGVLLTAGAGASGLCDWRRERQEDRTTVNNPMIAMTGKWG